MARRWIPSEHCFSWCAGDAADAPSSDGDCAKCDLPGCFFRFEIQPAPQTDTVPDAFALAHAAISRQPVATTAGLSPAGCHPRDSHREPQGCPKGGTSLETCPATPTHQSQQSSSVCLLLDPTMCSLVLCCVPLPALTPSQGTSATSARGLRGGKRIHKPHPTPQPHCQPPDCPTIVIPRLQISDLTLYPFWFSSGLILSGCEETQGQLRTRDGLSAMPAPRAHQPQRGLSRVRAT